MKTFEERMRFIRGELTMEAFASMIGATKQKVHNYESGKVKPTFDIFENMVKAGYNVNWLLTGEGEMKLLLSENSMKLLEENKRLQKENDVVKKMVGLEAIKYIESSFSLNDKPSKSQMYNVKGKK